MAEQETKDGLPVTSVTADEFKQMVDQGETVPLDPLTVQINPMELVAELEREIGNLTGNAALGRVSLQAFSTNARRVVAEKDMEIAQAKAAEEQTQKRVRQMQHVLVAMKARMDQVPGITLQELIDGGAGWAPLPIEHLLDTAGEP